MMVDDLINVCYGLGQDSNSIILKVDNISGFSFGGVLAQMLAAHLWLLPHTHTDQLMSNVICITFGQPLIQSDLLTHVAEFFPDFRKNVHAIGLEDDGFPYIMENLDHLIFAKEVKS